ncbi:MAG: protein kinase [Zavarzinella sp.]
MTDLPTLLEQLRQARVLNNQQIAELVALPEYLNGNSEGFLQQILARGWINNFQRDAIYDGRASDLLINGYQLLAVLQAGSDGTHYLAFHPSLNKNIDLWCVNPAWLGTESVGDFVQRCEQVTNLNFPEIRTVYDIFVHQETPFVVQDFLEDAHLASMIAEMGPLPLILANDYARQAATGLAAAHERGIVHGKLSPRSLIVAPAKKGVDQNGRVTFRPLPGAIVQLVGIGLQPLRPPLSQIHGEQEAEFAEIVDFLPPERLLDAQPDKAWDIYGLGTTLFYLHTGKKPLGGLSFTDALLQLHHANPESLHAIRPDLPEELVQLIHAMMSRIPAERPSISEVVAVLARQQGVKSPSPQEPSPPGVMLASETGSDLTAPPVAEPVGQPVQNWEQVQHIPTGEMLPTFEPLNEHDFHAISQGGYDHADAFTHDELGADEPRVRRTPPPTKGINKMWIFGGLALHITATIVCIGGLTGAFSSCTSDEKEEEPKVQKVEKAPTAKPTPKKRPRRNEP